MGTQPDAYLKLRTPERRSLWLGAVCACIIPVGIGIYMLWPYFEYLRWECASSSITAKCFKNLPDGAEQLLFVYPFSLTFIFGTPLVAWLSCKRVSKAKSLCMSDILRIAIDQAGKVHLLALTIIVTLDILASLSKNSSSFDIFEYILIIMPICIANAFLYGLITVPLSWLCSHIFRFTALTEIVATEE
ncbi:MAG: hypothetical protein COA43_16320 [Robiginitomaculum sp.]|nr:MAG: hypothetical protein COA43_16320 [Robiginitomaculum sp.]